MNENVIKTELTKLRMCELNLSDKGITDEALHEIQFNEDVTLIDLRCNQIKNLDTCRICDCWVNPSSHIFAEPELVRAIRLSTQNMAAMRIQYFYRHHLIRRHCAAFVIQKQFIAYSYRIKGVVFRNAIEQYPSGSYV